MKSFLKRAAQLFYSVPWFRLSNIFSVLELRSCTYGRNTTEATLCPQYIRPGVCGLSASLLVMCIFISWLPWCPPSFLHCKITIFPFVIDTYLLEIACQNGSVSYFSPNFPSQVFTTTGWFLPESVITLMIAKWWFFRFQHSYYLKVCFFSERQSFPYEDYFIHLCF